MKTGGGRWDPEAMAGGFHHGNGCFPGSGSWSLRPSPGVGSLAGVSPGLADADGCLLSASSHASRASPFHENAGHGGVRPQPSDLSLTPSPLKGQPEVVGLRLGPQV